jgi:hypothetical protein
LQIIIMYYIFLYVFYVCAQPSYFSVVPDFLVYVACSIHYVIDT